jgi:hypothetical protein
MVPWIAESFGTRTAPHEGTRRQRQRVDLASAVASQGGILSMLRGTLTQVGLFFCVDLVGA